MKTLWTVMRKEFARFFKDRRMLFSTVLLPGLLIFAIYSLMGSAMEDKLSGKGEPPTVYAANLPASLAPAFASLGWEVQTGEKDAVLSEIAEGTAHLYMEFPADFDQTLANFAGQPVKVSLYYNSTETDSSAAYSAVRSMLDSLEEALANFIDVNDGSETYDLASEKDLMGMVFSMVVPLLLMMMLFSGCMSVAPESIAGEKERGTIATLLATPLKRSHLALGKVISLSAIAMLSALSSFIGIILSLPKMMGGADLNLSASAYGVGEYLLVLAVLISTVLVLVGAISIISTLAKSVKEASMLVMPLMIVVMVIAVLPMMLRLESSLGLYFIPLFNSVLCFSDIFAFAPNPTGVLVTALVNAAVTALLVFVVARLFDDERVMFSK